MVDSFGFLDPGSGRSLAKTYMAVSPLFVTTASTEALAGTTLGVTYFRG